MKIRFLLVAFFSMAINASAAECKPDAQFGAGCNPHDSSTTVKTTTHNDAATPTQKSVGGYENWSDSVKPGDWTTDENEIDQITGEACVVKSASGVCIDDGDD